jgi:hypothetical protein
VGQEPDSSRTLDARIDELIDLINSVIQLSTQIL